MKLRPALCLDLDDTIRFSKSGNFIENPKDIVLFAEVEKIIWEYKKQGFLICGITNQGGVAFGYKTPEDNLAELQQTRALFDIDPFDMIKYAYAMKAGSLEPYHHRSLLRKPQIGMLVECEIEAKERGIIIDWDNSIFVGDRESDKECAENAEIKFHWAKDFFHLK